MRTRRGTDFWPGELGQMIHQFERGDVVVSTLVPEAAGYFTGVVREVHPKLNKVLVAWGGGSIKQHDPDEIMLHPNASELIRQRMQDVQDVRIASRQMRNAEELVFMSDFPIAEFVDRFLQLYSQFFLFHWQTAGFAQHLAFESANEDMEELMDAFVEAYQGKYGRVTTGGSLPLFDYGAQSEVEFVEGYRDYVAASKDLLGDDDDDLKNIVDEMVARMNKLLYLLTLE